jgi:hypothetical protein
MFNIILYSRAVLTVILLIIIVYYIINWFLQLNKKKGTMPTSLRDELPLSPEEIENTMNQEMSEIRDEYDEYLEEDADEEEYDDETLIDDASAEEPEIQEEIPTEYSQQLEPEQQPSPETPMVDAVKNTKQYDYLFVQETATPEIPKDFDANRNIGQ